MANSSTFKEWAESAQEFLDDQQWYQELKSKWEELDPQSRIYLKFATVGIAIFSSFLIILTFIWSVHSLKSELTEKRMLLSFIQNASDEMRRLKEAAPSAGGKEKEVGNWPPYFESVGSTAGVDKSLLTLSPEKPGDSNDQTKEVLFDLSLKHVNIKQLVRFAFSLENGQRPVKLRNLSIETKSDLSGYLDATLAVSAFTVMEQK